VREVTQRRSGRDEHPAATSNRYHPFCADRPSHRDHEGIATTLAEIGDTDGASELGTAHHPAGAGHQRVQHGPLLLGEMSQRRDEITHRDLGRFRLEGSGDRSGP
jgi:hypothetical protein